MLEKESIYCCQLVGPLACVGCGGCEEWEGLRYTLEP